MLQDSPPRLPLSRRTNPIRVYPSDPKSPSACTAQYIPPTHESPPPSRSAHILPSSLLRSVSDLQKGSSPRIASRTHSANSYLNGVSATVKRPRIKPVCLPREMATDNSARCLTLAGSPLRALADASRRRRMATAEESGRRVRVSNSPVPGECTTHEQPGRRRTATPSAAS
jgi:hypothetical protein